MKEKWKTITHFPKMKISSMGRVRGVKCIRRFFLNSDGYYTVQLSNSTKDKKTCLVHRLVALHFCKKKKGLNYVDHINHIKTDNGAINLRWVTNKQNIQNRLFLSTKLLKEIQKFFSSGKSAVEISKHYQVYHRK